MTTTGAGNRPTTERGDIMGKTSTAVKNRYNTKAYDRIIISVPKGKREVYKNHAASKGKSLAGLIKELLEADMAHISHGN